MMHVVVLLVSLLVSGCAVFQHPRETLKDIQEQVTPAEFDAWAKTIKGPTVVSTLGNYLNWHVNNMTYTPDGIYDYPRHHLVTLASKSGDCDDAASMLVAAFYRAGGYGDFQPVMMSVFTKSGGHAVCVVRDDSTGWYYAASNWPKVFGPCATINDLASSIYGDWTYYKLFDYGMNVIKRVER